MLAFGVESGAASMILARGEAADTLGWFRLHGVATLASPLLWGAFLVALAHRRTAISYRWRAVLVAATGLAVGAAAAQMAADVLWLPPTPGPFVVAGLQPAGVYLAILEMLLSVAVLVGLEGALRAASVRARGRIKFLALGLGGIFIMRFYLASQVVAFRVVTADSLRIGAATLLIATFVMAVGIARDRLRGIDLTVSRALLYRSAVVSVLGMYLLAVGLLGWFLNYLEIPEKAFWGSVAIFISALLLALVLLSDRVRWRIRRFVELNLYRSRYDYREHWSAFTKRMASLVTVGEIGPQLLDALTETVGSTRAALYLAETTAGTYASVATSGLPATPDIVGADAPLIARLRDAREPVLLDADGGPRLAGEHVGVFGEGSVAVPLVWGEKLTGFILLGPERTGLAYGPEDLLFMATIGEQAAGLIATAHMSEALARTREFDAFNRLTSYVIHDVKNSVSALSLLARNALTYADDPEFQRDSIRTLSRTVERMTRLLGKLAVPKEAVELALEPVDLASVVDEAVRPLKADGRLTVRTDVQPVPPVSADPEALLQALQNLVKNAAESINGRGTVTVSVAGADGAAVVSVADTGSGMSEDFVRSSLFTPFRSTKDGGWGIGLFQARDIIERHGGIIAVISTPGGGTTFRVRLPVTGAEVAGVSRHWREGPA